MRFLKCMFFLRLKSDVPFKKVKERNKTEKINNQINFFPEKLIYFGSHGCMIFIKTFSQINFDRLGYVKCIFQYNDYAYLDRLRCMKFLKYICSLSKFSLKKKNLNMNLCKSENTFKI